MFETILVAIDPAYFDEHLSPTDRESHPCRQAIEQAMWLAKQSRGTLRFVIVLDEPPPRVLKVVGEQLAAEESLADQKLIAKLQTLVDAAAKDGIEAESRIRHGECWRELCKEASDCDIVIGGTRPHSKLERFLFGSTGVRLLRHCAAPVWLTKRDDKPEDEPREILVAVDEGEMGDDLLHAAVELARLMEARLHVLHTFEGRGSEQDLSAVEEKIHQMLSETDHRTIESGVQVFVTRGRPEQEILQHLEQHPIDLLVMGTVGRRGLRGLLVGNTAERILNTAGCSILVIKPSGLQTSPKQ